MAAEAIEAEQTSSEGGKLAREQLKKQIPELRKATRLEAARAFNRLVLADGASPDDRRAFFLLRQIRHRCSFPRARMQCGPL